MYMIRDFASGTEIETAYNYEEALEIVKAFEDEDKAEGNYTPDFYEIVEMNMNESINEECMAWFHYQIDAKNMVVVAKEDEVGWHRRIYLVTWNDDDGYTHVYVMRLWTTMETISSSIQISQDYSNCVKVEDFIGIIPEIVETIKRVR